MALIAARVFTTLLGVLLIGTIAAFLLYVPSLTLMSVAAIVMGLLLTFGLGVQVGGRRIRIHRQKTPRTDELAQLIR